MGTTDKKIGKGGSEWEKIREILCGGGASGDFIWFRDVGTDPPVG